MNKPHKWAKEIKNILRYEDGKLYSLIYGKISSINLDPIEKKPDWYNPHATVYKLLDKPREPAPKSKPRSAYKGISSSFSMYEGI